MKMLLGIKSKGGKSIGVSLKLKIGVSSKVFTVSALLAIGVSALARGTIGTSTNLGSFLAGVSSFLVLIEEKVVPRVSITSSIFSILEDFSSRDLIVSKGLTILCMELSSLFKFP